MKLLKSVFVAIALFISISTLHAEGLRFGLSAGSSHSDYNLSGYRSAISNQIGYHIAASASFEVPLFSLSPEMIYNNNRFDINDSSVLDGRCEVVDQRIDIPIVLGVNILNLISIEGGPLFTVYNRADATYYEGSRYRSEKLGRINPKSGYVIGLKLTLFDRIILGARYYGYAEDYDFSYSGYSIRSNTYALSVGFKL